MLDMQLFADSTTVHNYTAYMNENANLSSRNRSELCELAYSFRQEPAILLVIVLQCVLSLLTLTFIALLAKCSEMRRIFSLIGKDLKILILVGGFCYTVGNLNVFGFFAYKLVILVMDFTPCFYIWSGPSCYWSQKLHTSICLRAYLVFHCVLFIERFYVTFMGRFKNLVPAGAIGVLLGGFILIYAPINQTISQQRSRYEHDRVYCASLLNTVESQSATNVLSLMSFDFVVTVVDFMLLHYNKYQIQVYKKQSSLYSLERVFQLREMQISISFIYPFSLFHSVTYCLQMYAYVVYNGQVDKLSLEGGLFLSEVVYMCKTLANCSLMGFMYFYIQRKRKSNTIWTQNQEDRASIYFENFKRIIA